MLEYLLYSQINKEAALILKTVIKSMKYLYIISSSYSLYDMERITRANDFPKG